MGVSVGFSVGFGGRFAKDSIFGGLGEGSGVPMRKWRGCYPEAVSGARFDGGRRLGEVTMMAVARIGLAAIEDLGLVGDKILRRVPGE